MANAQCVDYRSEIRETVRQHIINRILFGDAARLEDAVSFQETGVLDSVGFLEVITFIEERFGLQVADRREEWRIPGSDQPRAVRVQPFVDRLP